MSFVSFERKEINFKIVYYGPPLGGKTTNLKYLHEVMPQDAKGKLTMLSTAQDRTLYFDFLPLKSEAIKGYVSRFQLYTVPGQPIYEKTRRIVLSGADGVVFVGDSQWSKMKENAQSFANLRDNLSLHGRSLDDVPYIFQHNKRDLDDIAPTEYMDFLLNHDSIKAPCLEAVAKDGIGVTESLNRICKMVMAQFIQQNNMSAAIA
ncbi:MAG: signal recognition particle receptor subunit beta [Candidatus Promineifilaceae bacterium]|jgi:signal recognition particle receptor subunit beta